MINPIREVISIHFPNKKEGFMITLSVKNIQINNTRQIKEILIKTKAIARTAVNNVKITFYIVKNELHALCLGKGEVTIKEDFIIPGKVEFIFN